MCKTKLCFWLDNKLELQNKASNRKVYKLQLSLVEKYTIQGFCFLFFFLVINVISLINKSNTIFIFFADAAAVTAIAEHLPRSATPFTFQ